MKALLFKLIEDTHQLRTWLHLHQARLSLFSSLQLQMISLKESLIFQEVWFKMIYDLKYHVKEGVEIFKYFTLKFSKLSFQHNFKELLIKNLESLFKQYCFIFQSIDWVNWDRSHVLTCFTLELKAKKSVLIRSF